MLPGGLRFSDMTPQEMQAEIERLSTEHQQLAQHINLVEKALGDRITRENQFIVNVRNALGEAIDGTNLAQPEKERIKRTIGAAL